MRHDVEYQNHKNRRIELIQEAEVDRLSDLHRAHTQTDGLSGNFKRIGIVVALMVVLLAGSVAHAQADSPLVPQWVRDRQQYETRYEYPKPFIP